MEKKTYRWNDLQDKVAILVGTRPGIIKMSPLVHEFRERGFPYVVIHSGQHYSINMDKDIMKDAGIVEEDIGHHVLETREMSLHGEQTAQMLMGIEKALIAERPKYILVCGDANTNLAGALAARKLRIGVGHVEAGLRSRDWRMPEEHNRIMIDHISELLFPPTEKAASNLRAEKVRGLIRTTGNTIVDATILHLDTARERSGIRRTLGIENKRYVVLTSHREETVDDVNNLEILIGIIGGVINELSCKVVFPVHPRTRKNLQESGMMGKFEKVENLLFTDPLGYMDFLCLLSGSSLVVTDSGGIQEEACIMGIPCITIRETTERPETVEVGANTVTGLDERAVVETAVKIMNQNIKWQNPFGDGNARIVIADTVIENLASPLIEI